MTKLIVGIILWVGSVSAQPIYFNRHYNSLFQVENGEDIIQLKIGGYLLANAAYDYSNFAKSSIYLVRASNKGEEIWTKLISNRYYGLEPWTIREINDNKFIIGGNAPAIGSICSRFFLAEIDSSGDTLWVKRYENIPTQFSLFADVITTSDNGFLSVGTYDDTCNESSVVYACAIKTDSMGNIQWQGKYGGGIYTKTNGYSAIQTNDNGYFISGSSSINDDGSHSDGYVIRIDSQGQLIWQKTYGDFGLNEYFRTIIKNIGNGYFLAGSKDVDIGHDSILERDWAVGINDSGEELFNKTYADSNYFFAKFWKATITNDSNITLIADNTPLNNNPTHGSIIKLTPTGDLLWLKNYHFPNESYHDYFWGLQQTSDSGYIIIGTCHPHTQDVWLLKTDQFGCDTPDCRIATGINSPSNTINFFSIFPNPANNKITILYNFPTYIRDAVLEIYDTEGRLLYTEHLDTHMHELSLATNQWPQGLYACSMYSTNQLLKGKIFMIIR